MNIEPQSMKWWPIAAAWVWIVDRNFAEVAKVLAPGADLQALISAREAEFDQASDELIATLRNGLVEAKGLYTRGRTRELDLPRPIDPGEWLSRPRVHVFKQDVEVALWDYVDGYDRWFNAIRVRVADLLAVWPIDADTAKLAADQRPETTKPPRKGKSKQELVREAYKALWPDQPPPRG